MEFRRHLCRALFEDHRQTLAFLVRLEAFFGRGGAAFPRPFLDDLTRAVESGIGPHFAFEEEEVFPLLAAAGEEELGGLLLAEHRALLPLAERIKELAALGRKGGFGEEDWGEFRDKGAALLAGLGAHIEKEDRALLPLLDEILEEEEDARLSLELAGRR